MTTPPPDVNPALIDDAFTASAVAEFARVAALARALDRALADALEWDDDTFAVLVPHDLSARGRDLLAALQFLRQCLRRTCVEAEMPPAVLRQSRELRVVVRPLRRPTQQQQPQNGEVT